MSPELQRVKIAESRGWKVQHEGPEGGYVGLHPRLHQPDDAPVDLPDYTGSLDAIIEAVRRLPVEQRDTYRSWLCRIVDRQHRMAPVDWLCITATPEHHCEAYLQTIKEWQDER